MRRLKHIIYTVLILALIGYVVSAQYPEFKSWLTASKKNSSNPQGTTVQQAYQIKQNKWTTFIIEPGTQYLKFLTNAIYFKTHETSVNYAISVEILNSSSKKLLNQSFYFNNDTKLYKRKHSSRILSNPFLVEGKSYITPNLTFILPLSDLKNPTSIKLKWKPEKTVKNVKGVLARISSQAQVSNMKKNVLWYRLSFDSRKGLASGNFYPSYMLTKKERKNIISHIWSPIGPEGYIGHDYFVRRVGKMPTSELIPLNLLVRDDPKTEEKNGYKTDMFKIYVDSGLNGLFYPQSTKDINAAKDLFIKLYKGSTALKLKDDWKKLGMNITEFKRGKRVYTVVYEDKNNLKGRGFYLFCRSGLSRNISLEIPHRFWDTHTGIIGYKLMLTGYFSAAAWNTVHRYQTPNDLTSSSDMAHAENSFFYSFTKAFAEQMPKNSILIQPHGFSNKNQKSYYGKKASVILSNSTSEPPEHFLYYAKLIKKIMPQPAYIYPLTNVKWLAALDNVSAEVIRNNNQGQIFIHMEMNDKTREDMAKEFKLRKKFTECLKEKTIKLYPAVGK